MKEANWTDEIIKTLRLFETNHLPTAFNRVLLMVVVLQKKYEPQTDWFLKHDLHTLCPFPAPVPKRASVLN